MEADGSLMSIQALGSDGEAWAGPLFKNVAHRRPEPNPLHDQPADSLRSLLRLDFCRRRGAWVRVRRPLLPHHRCAALLCCSDFGSVIYIYIYIYCVCVVSPAAADSGHHCADYGANWRRVDVPGMYAFDLSFPPGRNDVGFASALFPTGTSGLVKYS